MAVGAGAGARTPPYTDLSARDDGKFLAQQFSVVLPRSCSSLNTDVFIDDIFSRLSLIFYYAFYVFVQ